MGCGMLGGVPGCSRCGGRRRGHGCQCVRIRYQPLHCVRYGAIVHQETDHNPPADPYDHVPRRPAQAGGEAQAAYTG